MMPWRRRCSSRCCSKRRDMTKTKTKTTMKKVLDTISGNEELMEEFFITLFDEIASDDEPARKQWSRLREAYEKDPDMVDDLLVTLCGWNMKSIIEKAMKKF